MEGKYNYIDLFAGAGVLSEGFVRAGFYAIGVCQNGSLCLRYFANSRCFSLVQK